MKKARHRVGGACTEAGMVKVKVIGSEWSSGAKEHRYLTMEQLLELGGTSK